MASVKNCQVSVRLFPVTLVCRLVSPAMFVRFLYQSFNNWISELEEDEVFVCWLAT